jgi:hypothetical protein
VALCPTSQDANRKSLSDSTLVLGTGDQSSGNASNSNSIIDNHVEQDCFENWYRTSFEGDGGVVPLAILLAEAKAATNNASQQRLSGSWQESNDTSSSEQLCSGCSDTAQADSNSQISAVPPVNDVTIAIAGAQATANWIDQWALQQSDEVHEAESKNGALQSTAAIRLATALHPLRSPSHSKATATAIACAKTTTLWIDSWAEVHELF